MNSTTEELIYWQIFSRIVACKSIYLKNKVKIEQLWANLNKYSELGYLLNIEVGFKLIS